MKLRTAAVAVLVLAACQSAPRFEGEPYGEPLTLTEVTEVSEILATPAEYVGKRVLVEGEVVAVCEQKGCWMDLETSDDAEIQIKVPDDVIVFPVSARGKTALVEGIVEERQLTSEQAFAAAAHRAEEQGEAFDSTAVFAATTVYRIQGSGALIRD
jgi:hypothetical protein